MASFRDLSEQERIQQIKDSFILIIENLVRNPSQLNNYFKLEKPKPIVAVLEEIKPEWTTKIKRTAETHNKSVQAKVDAENAKLENAYQQQVNAYEKVKAIISNVQKKEGCKCGTCISMDIANTAVPKELEILIDFARKEAETRVY